MKKLSLLFLVVIALLTSCVNNEPKVYTSIVGGWRCQENSIRGIRTYIIDIYTTTNPNTYLISNFENSGDNGFTDIQVILKNSNITISEGQQAGDVIVNSGSGTVSSDFKKITLEYKVYDNGQDITVNAVYTR